MSIPIWDGDRIIHLLSNREFGRVREHSASVSFIDAHVKKFLKAAQAVEIAGHERPRVAIVGWCDYMWLRAGVNRFWEDSALKRYDTSTPKHAALQDYDFPTHFVFHGITIFESNSTETGFTFA